MAEFDSDQLTEAFISALETMAYISPLPWEGPIPSPPASSLVVSIRHHADRTRTTRLVACQSFAAHLAANVLGEPEVDDDATQRATDALKELMNVVAGALLRAAGSSSTAVLALELPSVKTVTDPAEWHTLVSCPGTVTLDADGHFLALAFAQGD